MFNKLGVFFIVALACSAQKETEPAEWDIAVAIDDQVELLYSNGTLLGVVTQFSKLKALTFDDIRHEFVVSDMDQQNDTIYSVHLTKETAITPIVQNLPDDVQGLAIDPVTDTLYWTDTPNKTINYVSLRDPDHISRIFLSFDDKSPQDIAIDICQRYLYWTNSEINNPSIERVTLDRENHEILITDDLVMPLGIAVDQMTQRIFWTDNRQGIYYRIESARLDGSYREIIHEGTHQDPFGIAVDKEAVYWTDVNNNALWKTKKRPNEFAQRLRDFKEQPMGIVTKHLNINISECENYANALEKYNGSSIEIIEKVEDDTKQVSACLNRGEPTELGCKCQRGFTGRRCETSFCYNFCMHGNCHISSLGYPQCRCPLGFAGTRCEKNICDDYCLNGGKCLRTRNATLGVACQCKENFFGHRCERSFNPTEMCSLFCKERDSDVLMDQMSTFVCRCEQGSYKILESTKDLKAFEYTSVEGAGHPSLLNHFQDTAFVILSVCMLLMLALVIALSIAICRMRRRPRIKKRIIVNKNVTPLTYRPSSTSQQCEITIENCCNMNVCETPCFEPPQLRGFQASKKDEKKTLLSNMENGEDLY